MNAAHRPARVAAFLAALMLALAALPLLALASAEKVVNIGVTDSLGTLNPLLQDGGELNKYATGLQFLPLVELGSDLQFEGQLAESVTTEDNLTFTVRLYKDAAWSDGVPVTADDVIFTVLQLTSRAVGNITMGGYAAIVGFDENGFSPDGAQSVEGVRKIDDKTLSFTFRQQTALVTFQNSYARYLLTLPKHVLGGRDPAALKTDPWFNSPDVVSGPFIVTDFDPNHYISYRANAAYWRGAPKIDRLNIKIVAGAQIYAGLKSGEIDFVQQTTGVIPPEDYDSIAALPNVTAVLEEPLTNQLAFINTRTVPDPRVRQAILHAIDRRLLVTGLLMDRGEVVDGFFSSYSPYFDAGAAVTPYDPAKARALLADAGWDSGRKLSFLVNAGDATFVQAASVIAAQLAEAGIRVEIRTVDFASIWAYVQAGDFDIYVVQYTIPPVDPYLDVAWLVGGPDNYIGYRSDLVDSLLPLTQSERDPGEVRKAFMQINAIVQREVPLFSVYVLRTLGAVNNRLLNAEPRVYGSFSHIERWEVAD